MSRESVEFRVVRIGPIECLKGAKRLVGKDFWLFVAICLVALLVGGAAPMGILMGPMMCGMHLCFRNRRRGVRVRFEMLFKGFDHFIESLIVSVILFAAMMAVIVPLYVLMVAWFFSIGIAAGVRGPVPINPIVVFGGFLGIMAIIFVVIMVASILMQAISIFVYPLIVDRKLRAMPALQISIKAAWANLGGIAWLVIVTTLLYVIAALACVFPAFLVLPLQYGAYHLTYTKVFPDPAESALRQSDEEPTTLRERDYVD